MNINKNIIIAGIGGVLLILLIFAAVMLFRGINQFGEAERNLVAKRGQLDGYYRKEPFPSADNVKIIKDNVSLLEEWIRSISDLAKRQQVEPDATKSPSAFVNMLSQVRNDLHSKAKKEGVQIEPEFAFGFGPYCEGQPATADFVPRLIQQLVIVDGVCKILIDEKAKEIHLIERDLFDGVPDAAAGGAAEAGPRAARGGRRPSATAAPSATGLVRASKISPAAADKQAGELIEGELASKMKFVFEFSAKESALINILNRLAMNEMFVVVTSVDIETADEPLSDQDKTEPAAANAPASLMLPFGLTPEAGASEVKTKAPELKRPPSRQERVICGGKAELPARIRIEFEVYRFK